MTGFLTSTSSGAIWGSRERNGKNRSFQRTVRRAVVVGCPRIQEHRRRRGSDGEGMVHESYLEWMGLVSSSVWCCHGVVRGSIPQPFDYAQSLASEHSHLGAGWGEDRMLKPDGVMSYCAHHILAITQRRQPSGSSESSFIGPSSLKAQSALGALHMTNA